MHAGDKIQMKKEKKIKGWAVESTAKKPEKTILLTNGLEVLDGCFSQEVYGGTKLLPNSKKLRGTK